MGEVIQIARARARHARAKARFEAQDDVQFVAVRGCGWSSYTDRIAELDREYDARTYPGGRAWGE